MEQEQEYRFLNAIGKPIPKSNSNINTNGIGKPITKWNRNRKTYDQVEYLFLNRIKIGVPIPK